MTRFRAAWYSIEFHITIIPSYVTGQCYSEVGGEERSLKCCKHKYEREISQVPSNVAVRGKRVFIHETDHLRPSCSWKLRRNIIAVIVCICFAMLRRSVRLFPPSICGWHNVILGADVPRTLSCFVIACSPNCVQVQPSYSTVVGFRGSCGAVAPRSITQRRVDTRPQYLKLTPSVTRQTVFSLTRT